MKEKGEGIGIEVRSKMRRNKIGMEIRIGCERKRGKV